VQVLFVALQQPHCIDAR